MAYTMVYTMTDRTRKQHTRRRRERRGGETKKGSHGAVVETSALKTNNPPWES
jgi:hypothetical protein